MDLLSSLKRLGSCNSIISTCRVISRRKMSLLEKTKLRFYQDVTVQKCKDSGKYMVCLDGRKLKTPFGNIFSLESNSLACAVAEEWHSQGKNIATHYMPLTNLCNSCLDNPSNSSEGEIQKNVLSFLNTDTLCFRVNEPEDFAAFQIEHWDPLVSWFQKRYGVKVNTSTDFMLQPQSDVTVGLLTDQLSKLTQWQLFALESATIALKSCMLSMATLEGHLDVEQAVYLSQLEMEFQIMKWGRVEWSHDVDTTNQKSQLAAAALIYSEMNS